MKKRYTLNYFIKKFKAIPADRWCAGEFRTIGGRCCVMGHCGMRDWDHIPPEAMALGRLIDPKPAWLVTDGFTRIVRVNNSQDTGAGIKAAVLGFLRFARACGCPESRASRTKTAKAA